MEHHQTSDRSIVDGMQLQLTTTRLLGEAEDQAVEHWWAIASVEAEGLDGEPTEQEVVRAHLVRCPLGNPTLWYILDGLEGDLGQVGSVILAPGTGEIDDEIAEHAEVGNHILILNSVVCDKRFAGRQIGRWIAAEAISSLSSDVALVAALAGPLDDSEGEERSRRAAKLRDVWTSVGFVEVEDGVMILNPALRASHEALVALRQRFDAPTLIQW